MFFTARFTLTIKQKCCQLTIIVFFTGFFFDPVAKKQLNNSDYHIFIYYFSNNDYNIFAGLFGCAFFLILVPFVGCDPVLAVSLLCAACGVNAFGAGGFSPNHVDLSSRFVVVLVTSQCCHATVAFCFVVLHSKLIGVEKCRGKEYFWQ